MSKLTSNKLSPKVRSRGSVGSQPRPRLSVALDGDCFDCKENWLRGPDAQRMGEEGRDRHRQACWRADRYNRQDEVSGTRELRARQANEILRKASAYFAAAELDHRSKSSWTMVHGVEPICKFCRSPLRPTMTMRPSGPMLRGYRFGEAGHGDEARD